MVVLVTAWPIVAAVSARPVGFKSRASAPRPEPNTTAQRRPSSDAALAADNRQELDQHGAPPDLAQLPQARRTIARSLISMVRRLIPRSFSKLSGCGEGRHDDVPELKKPPNRGPKGAFGPEASLPLRLIEFWAELGGTIHPRDLPILNRYPHSLNTDYPPPAFIARHQDGGGLSRTRADASDVR
jgi:hypothetical protein